MSVINLAVVFIFGVSEMAMHASAGNALAVAQRVCRNPRGGADATDEVFRRAGDLQNPALLGDDGARQCAHVSVGGLYRRHARQSVRRNLDNSHLIRRQAENV
jgi:hypothetical protein